MQTPAQVPSQQTIPQDVNPPPDEQLTSLASLSSLLEDLEEATAARSEQGSQEANRENQFLQVRLGLASSLFIALRTKHAPTAAHSLRVALGCSSWTQFLNLDSDRRDEIEVAALLHDVGKIGVPDHVLLKPGKLTPEETLAVEQHRSYGRDILSGCCASRELLDVIHYIPARFDGSKRGFAARGEELPLGSRLIAIVDAFDAMTTDRVFRRAMSRERAMAELFEHGGTQFDPKLVKSFCELLSCDQVRLSARQITGSWLRGLAPESANSRWKLNTLDPTPGAPTIEELFHVKLLESMHDGVIFVDNSGRIVRWNRAAERLTGITASSILDKRWSPDVIAMHDEQNTPISQSECPLFQSISSGTQTKRRLTVRGRGGERLSVDAHMVPVLARDGARHGVTLLLHDASSQITLEERVQSLHHKATRDPLTQIANRAEFDKAQKQFVETHSKQGLPCCLIICDIDHFKRVNDTFGHQAGDEAIISIANLLAQSTRSGDFVARYGGEEFVMLCADCDNTTATRRAEEIRRLFAETRQSMLNGECITASFGVTELQDGDTAETMLRRADRALLQAKDSGRNCVVQLGIGRNEAAEPKDRNSWLNWFRGSTDELLETELVTPVPLAVAVEKLKGFVADHHAQICRIVGKHIDLEIDGQNSLLLRRDNDRRMPFVMTLEFDEVGKNTGSPEQGTRRTKIHVAVHPKRQRDRRRDDTLNRARQIVASLKSYLMAHDFHNSLADEPQES